jgi:hypothetical protein
VREVWSIEGETCVLYCRRLFLYVRGQGLILRTETKPEKAEITTTMDGIWEGDGHTERGDEYKETKKKIK